MARKTRPDHVHRYIKKNIARKGNPPYEVYKCVKPFCTNYIPITLAEGTTCECNQCGSPMIITRATLMGNAGKPLVKPHCIDCTKRKSKDDVAAITEFLTQNIPPTDQQS